MKKTLVFSILLITIAVIGERIIGSVEKKKKQEKLEILKHDKVLLISKMSNLRMNIIKSDFDLNKLHKKIISLHKELAIKVNEKKAMKDFNRELKNKNEIIEELQQELKNNLEK